MHTSPPPSSPIQSARALLKQLQETYPIFREHKPLAIGIDKQLFAQMEGVNKKTMRMALSLHTSSVQYLKAMEKATVRYNLDGTTAGEVDDTHRTHASETLRARFKKAMEQKKAQEAAAKAERQHAEKLKQLTEKFSPRR
ncbi:MAG TPA: ProQ/FINO family protein [Noviherbaspirillum sp.]|nr:ProQ/FINO family protein [Noviherbaspirillum sp.]